MSGSRRLVSLFIAFHLLAIALDAIPNPTKFNEPSSRDELLARPTPVLLDKLAMLVRQLSTHAWQVTAIPRALGSRYVQALGFNQQWTMFANPPQQDDYVRIRYFVSVGPDSNVTRTATELVFPAHREDRVRAIQSFRDSYMDRAFNTTLENYHRRLGDQVFAGKPVEAMQDDPYLPIARHFSRRFAASLAPTERLVRFEIWHGTGQPGALLFSAEVLQARWTVLNDYYQGPIETQTRGHARAALLSTEREADIEWSLEYLEER